MIHREQGSTKQSDESSQFTAVGTAVHSNDVDNSVAMFTKFNDLSLLSYQWTCMYFKKL